MTKIKIIKIIRTTHSDDNVGVLADLQTDIFNIVRVGNIILKSKQACNEVPLC